MANPEHLNMILQQDVEQWNKWRAEHPNVEPDLSGADLSGSDHLEGIDLHGADLRRANFDKTWHHNSAYIFESCLEGANLSHARLGGASFWSTKLRNANL